jgi:hypothetical protein
MTKLHQCKAAVGTERAATIDYSKPRARARAVAVAINNEGTPPPTFPRAKQNTAATIALLDTLPAPSTNEVSKVYQQLRNFFGVATEQ